MTIASDASRATEYTNRNGEPRVGSTYRVF